MKAKNFILKWLTGCLPNIEPLGLQAHLDFDLYGP